MRICFTQMSEAAAQLEDQAAQIRAVTDAVEKLILALQCEASLEAVGSCLKKQQEPLMDQIRCLKAMAGVLEQASARCGQSEIHIGEQYEEGNTRLFAAGYVEYKIPKLYVNVLNGL